MLLDPVTDSQMQTARILMAATMAAFVGVQLLRRQSRTLRMVMAGCTIAVVLGCLVRFLV